MNLKNIKYLTLRDASKYFDTSTDALCDWLSTSAVRIVARSDFDDGKYHALDEETLRPLLAAADKKVRRVVFKYPPEMKKFRFKGSSRFDDQTLSQADLRISIDEIERIKDNVVSEIGGVISENYGVKKVRRTQRKWPKIHAVILSAANDLLAEDSVRYANKKGQPVCSKLAKAIDENRNRWAELADESYGTSYRNILEKIYEMKAQLKTTKKRT